jgi:hypothetical protein
MDVVEVTIDSGQDDVEVIKGFSQLEPEIQCLHGADARVALDRHDQSNDAGDSASDPSDRREVCHSDLAV